MQNNNDLEVNEFIEYMDIHNMFQQYNTQFFNDTLQFVIVEWSKRMTLCAGICQYSNNFCTIRLSEPLLKYRSIKELKETLLHEMIHAHVFINHPKLMKHEPPDGHGPLFLEKMYEINKAMGINITVFHKFHDEVDSYRVHIWRCDGICQNKAPYYGYVKRAQNRPPSERDPWYLHHVLSCGGTFTKISEPPKKEKVKKGRGRSRSKSPFDNLKQPTLDSYATKNPNKSPPKEKPISSSSTQISAEGPKKITSKKRKIHELEIADRSPNSIKRYLKDKTAD